MAFNNGSSSSITSTKRTSLGPSTATNSSLLIEKTKANMRRSTPDSEALASSDDELDQHHRLSNIANQHVQKPTRRTSWLNEAQHPLHRTSSNSTSEHISPSSSYMTSSGTDATSWGPNGSGIGRGPSNNASFPWGSTIWNNDAQKAPPSRLAEVLPSPTSLGANGFTEEPLSSPPLRRDSTSDAAIPFAIPLHPTLKSYRSQSYSVGQLDQDSVNTQPARQGQNMYMGRVRPGSSYSGLQHRPSRPSMLGDFSPDTSVLEQLREVPDDDETSTTSSEAGVRLSNTQARTIEQLAMENAILRQQALAHQSSNVAASNALYSQQSNLLARFGGRNIPTSDSVLEEHDDVSSNTDEQGLGQNFNHQCFTPGTAENRQLENVKKGQWQSSLGFGGIADIPQSRRHSFAEVPLRHSSISSHVDGNSSPAHEANNFGGFRDGQSRSSQADNASYFSNPLSRSSELYRPSSSSSSQHAYPIHQPNRSTHHGHQPHQGQLLYLVTFKAARAEFYYIQEGTGLEVNTGDLVIVEADRGTDLGTVAHKNVDWSSAKELKDRYVAEHYNWLMVFSRQGQNGGATSTGAAMPSSSMNQLHGSAIGGMGPFGPATATTDSSNVEIKPKMIKRLAQSHEILLLREKEGNEAKAKRMCQQKVAEHHLNMEILDAEFQMDWKKLTFYYFAEAYVNFNSLVTDLFKIYKTRIWMSAINPASFVSPSAGPQLPLGIGSTSSPYDHGDAYPEARSKLLGFNSPSLNDLSQGNFDNTWNPAPQNINSLPPPSNNNPHPFSPYFHNPQQQQQGFQTFSSRMQDYGRGGQGHQNVKSQSSFDFLNYNGTGKSSGAHHRDSVQHAGMEYKDEMAKNPYTDQFKALQGLSLGS